MHDQLQRVRSSVYLRVSYVPLSVFVSLCVLGSFHCVLKCFMYPRTSTSRIFQPMQPPRCMSSFSWCADRRSQESGLPSIAPNSGVMGSIPTADVQEEDGTTCYGDRYAIIAFRGLCFEIGVTDLSYPVDTALADLYDAEQDCGRCARCRGSVALCQKEAKTFVDRDTSIRPRRV